jgi:hypothetical protein
MIAKLNSTHIHQLILMIPVLNDNADPNLLPILTQIEINYKIRLNPSEIQTLKRWDVPPEQIKAKNEPYKAAKVMTFIVIKWFKTKGFKY